MVKNCLKKVLGNAKLSFEELNTVLQDVTGILNSRPLTYLYDEIGYSSLTPSNLLYGRRLPFLADNLEFDPYDIHDSASSHTKRFWYLVKKLNHFASRWKHECLIDLREVHRSRSKGEKQVQEGDVVLIKEDNLKRSQWQMERIQKLNVRKDGVTRGAMVCMYSTGKRIFYNRPLQKLFPLEMKKEGNVDGEKGKETEGKHETLENKDLEEPRARPQRAAAKDAAWKTRLALESE